MSEESEKPQPLKKRVDESWKEAIQKEKSAVSKEAKPSSSAPETDPVFSNFISTLATQAMMALGEMTQPGMGAEADPQQAKYLIDILQALQKKTQKNLSKEEEDMLKGVLYELQMKFVQKKQAG